MAKSTYPKAIRHWDEPSLDAGQVPTKLIQFMVAQMNYSNQISPVRILELVVIQFAT